MAIPMASTACLKLGTSFAPTSASLRADQQSWSNVADSHGQLISRLPRPAGLRRPYGVNIEGPRAPLTTCMAKGFGAGAKSAKPSVAAKVEAATKSKTPVKEVMKAETVDVCSCGGGLEKKAYKECCGPYHGGVKEPNPAALLRARYVAFARGVIPYLVRTTHPDNPDLKLRGAEGLKADCTETCRRVAFKRLDVGEMEAGANDDEAFLLFQAVYAYKDGTTSENQVLAEKSRFLKEGGRWLYREKMTTDPVANALWKHGALLSEKAEPETPATKRIFGRAQPKLRPRSN